MPRWRAVLTIILGLCAAALPAAAQDASPAIRAFDIATIEKLGRAMAEQAQAASTADEILSGQNRNLEADGIIGWIFDPTPARSRVRFLHRRDGRLEVAYEVTFAKGARPAFAIPAKPEVTARDEAQLRARQLAADSIEKPCSPIYNTLAVPDPASPERWLVWVMATAIEPGAVAIGGHTRFTIAPDGSSILSRDALSLGCIVITPQPPPPGSNPAAAYVTHLISPTPVETHVFVSLLYDLPLLVGVPDQSVWQVQAGKIRKLPGQVAR